MAGGRVVECHSAQDWAALKAGSGGHAVIVDFSATWCGPCQMIGPVFEKLSEQYPKVKFVKIDVDECQDIASECGVRAMPTFQAYLNGSKVDELTGASQQKLQAMVEALSDKVSAVSGPGRKLGGSSDSAPAPGSSDMRAKLLAAAEARSRAAAADE